MIDLGQLKVTTSRNWLAQGGSNQKISGQLNLSPRAVKQPLRTLFLRAGIRKEIQISLLVWGLTNREIGKIVGPAEAVIMSHLGSAFDKLGAGAAWNWPSTLPVTGERIGPNPSQPTCRTAKPSG
jgi:DNA-binding CsgD family transcriptional regulator